MTKIIADACCNHLGDRRLIEQMIIESKAVGVDIIKFQSFNPDRLNPNWPNYEKSKEYYKSVALTDSDHVFILDKCNEIGIECLFTAMTFDKARFLHKLELHSVKIGSAEIEDSALINYCRTNFETVYISTGMAQNIDQRLLLRLDGIKLFYCISRYPAKYEDIDFDKMQFYDGFSDHTADIRAAKKAIDLGIPFIERHFTLGKYLPGNDHKFSSTPNEFKELCDYRNSIEKIEQYKRRWINE